MTGRIDQLKLVVLALIFSLCFGSSEVTKVQLNDIQEYRMEESEGGKEYYTATVEEDENTDLIVQINCLSFDCDPVLHLSVSIKQDQIPNPSQEPYCRSGQFEGMGDFCIIKKKDIKEGLKILVGVSCKHECKYSLNIVYKKKIEYQAEKGGRINIFFNEADIREILIKIPNTHLTNMLIQAQINKTFFNGINFELYGDKGQKISETKEEAMFQSVQISDKILAIPLSSKDLCIDCSFSIAIKAPQQTIISFSLVLYDNERELNKALVCTYDIVKQNEIQYFTIGFAEMLENEYGQVFEGVGVKKKFASHFLFTLNPYNGDPDLYIHYGENKPSSIDEYEWKSRASSRPEAIYVQSDQLNEIGYTQNSKFFIAVFGKDISAYELKTNIYRRWDLQIIYLNENGQFVGYVGNKKIQNYSLMVQGFKRDIKIVLQSYLGNSDLFVKKNFQIIKKEQVLSFYDYLNNGQSDQNQEISFIGWSINKKGQDFVKIKHDPADCSYNICTYQIAIYGNEESNKYVIETYSQEPSLIKELIENKTEYVFFDNDNKKCLFYQPMSLDEDIEQIRFQIEYASSFTMISADREIQNLETKPERNFVRSFLKYNENQFFKYKQQQISSKQNHYVEYNQSEIKQGKLSDHKYYVQLQTTQSFSFALIVVKLVRKEQQKVEYTELLSGFSSKLLINPRSSKHFKFIHQFGKKYTVVARSDSPIKMYIGKNKDLPPTSYQNVYDADSNTQSSNSVKIINIESSLSANQTYLFGTVDNTSDKEISVQVQSLSDTINIDLNTSFEDILIPYVQRAYSFSINLDIAKEEIYLFIQLSGTVLDQQLTGSFKINGKSVGKFKDNEPTKMYKVEQEDLKKECMNLFEAGIWQDCQVMIEVQSSKEQRLIVSVNGPNIPSYIQYLGSTISQLPLLRETRKFFQYIQGDQDLILTVQSYSYLVQLLSKIITLKQFREMDVSNGNNFPKFDDDIKNIQLITKPNLTHQVGIKSETIKGESCFEGCFLMLSVILPQDFEITDQKVIGNIIKLSVFRDKIIDLVEGESFQGTVEKEEMIYYRVYVPKEKNKEKFFINLTPLDNGNPDLFLNKDSSKLPTDKEFDLNSQEIAGDFIFVDQDSFKNSKGSDSISGYYIVGVYGESKSTYQIQYQTGKHLIQNIGRETIHQSTVNKGDIQYYVYHKKEKGFFYVVTNISQESSGDSYIFIKEFNNENDKFKDFMKNLDNPQNVDITTQYSNNKDILRYEKNDCDDCTYVIGVKADRKISFSLSVHVDNGVALIQNNKNHLVNLKKGVISKLRLFSNDDFNFYVSAYSGHCVEVRVSHGNYEQKQQLKPKLCSDSEDVKPIGFDSFNLFVQHPDIESAKQEGLHYNSIFDIQLISPYGDEQVIVLGVSGREARLISAGIPLEQTISSENKLVQFTYYSIHEGMQAAQVQISPEYGSEDDLEFINFDMVVLDKGESILQNTIAHTKDLYTKSFITNMNIPYLLNVQYAGTRELKFSILLKETNLSSIPILSSTAMDELPLKETSNYVISVQPQQYVLIQNFNCISDQNIFIYTNSTDLLIQNSNAERITKRSTSNHEIQIMKINQDNSGEIYIQKRANKQSVEKKSISLIQSEIFQEDEPIIYNYIQIANSGILDVHQEENKIEVSFKDIECIVAECYSAISFALTKIEYTLHVGENSKDLQRITNCLLRESSDLRVNDEITSISLSGISSLKNQETRKFVIDKYLIPTEINKLYVSVSARAFTDNQNTTYRFIYGSHIVNDLHSSRVTIIEDNSDSNQGFIIAICVVSILILIITVLKLYRSNKQVQKKLQQEMNDASNNTYSDLEKKTFYQKDDTSIFPMKDQSEN